MSSGGYPYEVGWILSCSDGLSLSCGAPFEGSTTASLGASCSLTMTDSFGDGWNGATWTALSQSISMPSGSGPFSVTFVVIPLPPMAPLPPTIPPSIPPYPPAPPLPPYSPSSTFSITVSGGSWQSEVGWILSCTDGATLSGGNPFSGSVSTAGGGTCTLTMTDSFGDGWNGAQWVGIGQTLTMASGSGPFYVTFYVSASASGRRLSDVDPSSSSLPSVAGTYVGCFQIDTVYNQWHTNANPIGYHGYKTWSQCKAVAESLSYSWFALQGNGHCYSWSSDDPSTYGHHYLNKPTLADGQCSDPSVNMDASTDTDGHFMGGGNTIAVYRITPYSSFRK